MTLPHRDQDDDDGLEEPVGFFVFAGWRMRRRIGELVFGNLRGELVARNRAPLGRA